MSREFGVPLNAEDFGGGSPVFVLPRSHGLSVRTVIKCSLVYRCVVWNRDLSEWRYLVVFIDNLA